MTRKEREKEREREGARARDGKRRGRKNNRTTYGSYVERSAAAAAAAATPLCNLSSSLPLSFALFSVYFYALLPRKFSPVFPLDFPGPPPSIRATTAVIP